MASGPKAKKREMIAALETLRSYRSSPLGALLAPFDASVDDRTAALIISTNLEHALEDAIATHFVGDIDKLKGRIFRGGTDAEGILCTFYAKTYMAHALGIIGPKTLADLNTIIMIRNIFAHSAMQVSFQMKSITEACVFLLPERLPAESDINKGSPHSSREMFIKVGTTIGGALYTAATKLIPDEYYTPEVIEDIKASSRMILA